MTTILVVDDDHSLRQALSKGLGAHGYDVVTATSGHEAISLAAKTYPHLLLVDLGLPQDSGVDVVTAVRGWSGAPIIVVSTRLQVAAKASALDAGADDYLMKPFGINELLARIRAALRRSAPSDEESVVVAGELSIDLGTRDVRRRGQVVHLRPKAFATLALLVRRRGNLVSEPELLEQLWGPGYQEEREYLSTIVLGLRGQLEDDASAPHHLTGGPGLGYRFEPV